jgi:ketosteroid isomerase-like protein
MSQENVEIVRQANEAFNRGDIERCLAIYADDVEVEDLMNAPDLPSKVHGIEEFRQVVMAWVQEFDGFRIEIVELIDDGDHVVALADYSGKSRAGVTTHHRQADVYELRNGKVVRATFSYSSREDALEAVGLSE